MEPKVGVGVAIVNNGKVLLGKRKSEHGKGEWCFPGGHLEYGEEFVECAKRETKEETGLDIANVQFCTATNDVFDEKHYVTIIMIADYDGGEPELEEPEKFEKWRWFEWTELPEPLFLPIRNLIKKGLVPGYKAAFFN